MVGAEVLNTSLPSLVITRFNANKEWSVMKLTLLLSSLIDEESLKTLTALCVGAVIAIFKYLFLIE
jgi:hypothetical protein